MNDNLVAHWWQPTLSSWSPPPPFLFGIAISWWRRTIDTQGKGEGRKKKAGLFHFWRRGGEEKKSKIKFTYIMDFLAQSDLLGHTEDLLFLVQPNQELSMSSGPWLCPDCLLSCLLTSSSFYDPSDPFRVVPRKKLCYTGRQGTNFEPITEKTRCQFHKLTQRYAASLPTCYVPIKLEHS